MNKKAVLTSAALDAVMDELKTVEKFAKQKWSFEIPPEAIPESEISETKESEIIVVGAGTAGLCTAISAAEMGGKVILFSCSAAPVGRGGSIMAVYSKYMEQLGVPRMEAEPFLRDQLKSCYFNVDTRKWYKWYNNSEESMNWLIDHMAETEYELLLEQGNRGMDPKNSFFCPSGTHGWVSKNMGEVGNGQPFVVKTLAQKAIAAGIEIIYNVTAEQLVREDDNKGRVTAVIGKDKAGKYIKFAGSKAIVLATGDFSKNHEMVLKYSPQCAPYVVNLGQKINPDVGKVYGGLYEGSGQKMGLWVGAAWQRTYPNAPMLRARFGANNLPFCAPTGLVVNSEGVRFFSEEITVGFIPQLLQHQPNQTVYHIWDAGYARKGQPWYLTKTPYGSDPATPEKLIQSWDEEAVKGTMFKADTLEKLIAEMGLPTRTIGEIKRYNGFCATGLDTDFYKRKELLISIDEGPFYGASSKKPVLLSILGGLRTNINMQVCEDDDTPIPGLYNVGSMIGDMFAGCYSFQIAGHCYGICITFGYLTGHYIVENE